MAINTEEFEKIKESAEMCVLREEFTSMLANTNSFLNVRLLNDYEFKEEHKKQNPHPTGIFRGILIGGGAGFLSAVLIDSLTNNGVVAELVLLLMGAAGAIISYMINERKYSAECEKALKEYQAKRDEYKALYPEQVKKREEYTEKLKRLVAIMRDRSICVIPERYWNDAPLLVHYIEDCRAHDLESAINVLEQEKHNMLMQSQQAEMLLEQQKASILAEVTAEYSAITAYNTARAANAAESAATASWLNYIFND